MSKLTAREKIYGFLDGQEDCKHGKPHKDGKGKDYDNGYNFEEFRQESKRPKISELGKLL